jgi:hypothetical protein
MEKQNQEILNEAMSRFQQIMEYTTRRNKYTEEAGEQPQEDPSQMPPEGGAPMDGEAPGGDMGGEMPQDGGAPMDPNGGAPAPGGDMGGEMPQDGGAQGPEGFNPQVPQDGMDAGMSPMDSGAPMDGSIPPEGGELQPGDDVIDVSDLTDSQEETQEEVDKLDAKFDKVMKYLGQFEELIKSNDDKINDLKAEFERRNPTQVEKLSMQTANSYPFSETPEQYWDNKEKTSNYRTEDDQNGVKQGQYLITKNDVDGTVDWKGIADTLDDFDIMHQTMKNTMGLPM